MSQSSATHTDLTAALTAPWRVRLLTAVLAFLTVTVLVALAAPRAGAITDAEELTQIGGVGSGSGAGQFSSVADLGSDPTTGHLFVSEAANSRISEFTPWGSFVKAFGWDVAPGAVNEQQEVRVRASSGQFKLSFGASTTPDLPFDAGAAQVGAALNGLASIGAGGSVEVKTVPGTTDGITPYIHVITFKGSLAASDVAQLTIAAGATPPGGGVPSTSLEVRTRADGTSGGTGLESCTTESGCKAGSSGSGAGQVGGSPGGVAVDAAGNVYLKEVGNLRVQKFDTAGRFILTFGGEVNKTTNANLCTATSGDTCGAGTPGTAPGQFSSGSTSGLALGTGGQLFAADQERIQRFNLQGEFEASIPVTAESVRDLAFDPVSEDLYVTYGGQGGVQKLDSVTGAKIGGQLDGVDSVATDPAGNVYSSRNFPAPARVLQYNSAGQPLSPPSCCAPPPSGAPVVKSLLTTLGTNRAGDLYVAACGCSGERDDRFITVFGPAPVIFEGPPPAPPQIVAQFAGSVDRTDAVVKADVNPNFFTNARFYLEYGTGKCSEGDCTAVKPLPPGALLTTKATNNPVTVTVFLEGLKPGTTYHYRFVAESLGGGPVRGVGGKVGVDGGESAFITYPTAAPLKTDCPNQGFRTGFSAPLSNCRAYEMVSPIDKNSGDIKSLVTLNSYNTVLTQSSTDGGRFTYTSFRSFADPKSSAYVMHYMASRQDGVGWRNEAINPPRGHADTQNVASDLDTTLKAFSPDLCDGWLVAAAEPVLAPGASEAYRQLYRHDNCGPGGYEALVGVEPTVEPFDFNAEFQGASADGRKAILRVRDKLTPEAASNAWQTYYSSNGELRLLCVLPSGVPSGANCTGGTDGEGSGEQELNRYASLTNAISADGQRVYWTDSADDENGPGKVYLRLNPGEEPTASGECDEAEPGKACTVEVSETESTKSARFLGASEDGARALFDVVEGTLEGNLYRFEHQEAGTSTLIAGETMGVLGASDDLSRVYFVSREELPETSGATAGEPNLYLDQEGPKTFIATLSEEDVTSFQEEEGAEAFSNTSSRPIYRSARVSSDGAHLAFFSTESLTGYDNTDQISGKADAEVYLYEAGAPGPVCVSCNPSGARPVGRGIKAKGNAGTSLSAAAIIPPAQFTLHFPHSLSADGRRVFFNSYDALLPRDTNGKADVYQWEKASGPGDCADKGADLYVPSSGGCLSLISSGQSPEDSEFLDTSSKGGDVFFTTNASLLPQDPGLIDVYDARAEGGLPGPSEPPGPCQGEACQIAPPPPNDPTPASASFRGAGNASAKKAKARCTKGKARRKGRCVAKRQKRTNKQSNGTRKANHNRRAAG